MSTKTFKEEVALPTYDKKPIEVILSEATEVNIEKSAEEILTWIASNVDQFIDNQKRRFKLDLILETEDGAEEKMPETRKLQNLYRAIPDDPTSDLESEDFNEIYESLSDEDKELITSIQECRDCLNEVTDAIHKAMRGNNELLEALFKGMGFYYEIQGISQGNLLLEELSGEVDISKFEYESFPIAVQVTSPEIAARNEKGELKTLKDEEIMQYMVPEGFTVWLEIAFKAKRQEMPSLF